MEQLETLVEPRLVPARQDIEYGCNTITGTSSVVLVHVGLEIAGALKANSEVNGVVAGGTRVWRSRLAEAWLSWWTFAVMPRRKNL